MYNDLEPGVDGGEELSHLWVAEGEGLARLVLNDDGRYILVLTSGYSYEL